MPSHPDIVERLRRCADQLQGEERESSPHEEAALLAEAATEIKDVRAALKQLEGMVAELAEAAGAAGLRSDTLRLWSKGKMAGGPFVALGVATPQTCKMIAAYRAWKAEN